ncbi:hypothetical protein [Carboxylicivirga sp. M1479]|uniref:hypothetical protein n=1 Tax=Carboxylicivirga sp. M1479 TaxID=2594476 RepID=UPI0011784C22|nr:hypothetical protein [Carboxylicivirga sp. M1479]TRX70895.1 hypothetical protein FNN09_09540 [Carboxylicivirga sp. M1479]
MNAHKSLKQIKLLYFIITILLAIFALISFMYITKVGAVYSLEANAESNLKSLIVILALVGIPASYMFQNRKVKHLDENMDAARKLQQYRMAFFIKIMTLEGISLLSLLGYLMTGNINQLMIFGLVYLFLLLNYPRRKSVLEELNIQESEL